MKQMRKKDWSHELTLAFAAPAPKRKEAFLKTMPVPQLDPRGFFFTQLQYIRKRTWIFPFLSCSHVSGLSDSLPMAYAGKPLHCCRF